MNEEDRTQARSRGQNESWEGKFILFESTKNRGLGEDRVEKGKKICEIGEK